MSKAPCFISENRTCEPACPDNLVFIIGSGSSEFKKDINVIRDVLAKFGYKGYFALLSEKEKSLDSFCDKICSKILGSQFCVVMLNDPVIPPEQYPDSAKKGVVLRGPRPNVYYEYGIAVAASKNIIPVMRGDMKLPFDVQHLDAILYEHLDELATKLIGAVDEIKNKPIKRRFVKEPSLNLLLLDDEDNATKSILAKPIYEQIKRVKRKSLLVMRNPAIDAALSALGDLTPLCPENRPDDLVQIGIAITNNGEAPATNVRVFLTFPDECELISESRFTFGIPHVANPARGGLFIDDKNGLETRAWTKKLGNDLTQDDFDKINVRFPSKKAEYKITACVTQDNYPPKEFEFTISIEPEFREKIVPVYEEASPEDTDPKVLEKIIKEFGEKEKQEK